MSETLNTIEAKDEKILILDSICNYLIYILDDISNHVTDSILRQKIVKALSITPAEVLELYRLERVCLEDLRELKEFWDDHKPDNPPFWFSGLLESYEDIQAYKENKVV